MRTHRYFYDRFANCYYPEKYNPSSQQWERYYIKGVMQQFSNEQIARRWLRDELKAVEKQKSEGAK